jgi:acyl-CoA synthetase (AMP-forming)/AMP-acid ligase II
MTSGRAARRGAPGAAVDAAELIALCKDKLARFKVPKHVLFTEPAELPITPTGKVQKFRLAQRAADALEGPAAVIERREPVFRGR